jgi:hypothetical protein
MRRHLSLVAFGLCCATTAYALDLPSRKAGLWAITMTFEARTTPPQIIQQCIDAATDKLMNAIGGSMSQEMCSKQDVKQVGNTYVIDSVCNIGPARVASHAVMGGDFNSDYTVKVTSTSEGMPAGVPGSNTMTLEAKWLGACKADQHPGDMILADGRKFNIRALQNIQTLQPPQKK